MRALVTGGAGFIGSNLVDALVDAGHTVTVVDNLSSGKEANLEQALRQGVTFHQADVAELGPLREIFEQARPELVFHLAAQIDVRKSVSDPVFDARVNVGGTAAVLEASRSVAARRVLFSSTGGAMYGDAKVIPTPEDASIEPMAPYGTSKYAAETYLGLYERLYGMSTIALRFGNVFGPRQDPHGEAGVIAIYCGARKEGRRGIVFGDGRQTRDYTYVGDIVSAALAAADHDGTGAFNVGTGVETTVLEIAEKLGVETDFQPARTGEAQRSCLDVTKAAEVLGWRSKVEVEEGLERTLEWALAE